MKASEGAGGGTFGGNGDIPKVLAKLERDPKLSGGFGWFEGAAARRHFGEIEGGDPQVTASADGCRTPEGLAAGDEWRKGPEVGGEASEGSVGVVAEGALRARW